MRLKIIILLILSLVAFSACTQRYLAIPKLNIAGQNLTESSLKISDYKIINKAAQGEDSFPIILFFPILGDNQQLYIGMINNAVEKVCKENNFKYMTNVKVYVEQFHVLLFGKLTIKIEGEGWGKGFTSQLNKELDEIDNLLLTNAGGK